MRIEYEVTERQAGEAKVGTFYTTEDLKTVCCEARILKYYSKPPLPFTLVVTDVYTKDAIKLSRRAYNRTLRIPWDVQEDL